MWCTLAHDDKSRCLSRSMTPASPLKSTVTWGNWCQGIAEAWAAMTFRLWRTRPEGDARDAVGGCCRRRGRVATGDGLGTLPSCTSLHADPISFTSSASPIVQCDKLGYKCAHPGCSVSPSSLLSSFSLSLTVWHRSLHSSQPIPIRVLPWWPSRVPRSRWR